MKNARGICPTCLRERGLTPQRQAITAHKVDGVRCEGSGAKPSEITRLADADYTATCPTCHHFVRLYGGRRLAAHYTNGKPCEMSGADLRAEVLPEPAETAPESMQLDFPPLDTNTDSQATCPTCQTTVSRQWGWLAEHDANGKPCEMSGAYLRPGLFLEPPGTARESGQPNPGFTTASRQWKSDQPPVTANFKSKWSDLLVSSGAGLIAMAIAVSLYVNGHWILGSIGALVAAVFLIAAWGNYQRSRRTPEEEASFQAKQRETSDRLKEDAQERKATKAQALRSQLRPPPPGATPPSPGALFLRLNEKRMHGLSKGPVVHLVCGRCAHSYVVPKGLISEYRREMSPGASLRRFNNPNVAVRQNRAELNLRCPSCGSIDPGVWIDG